MIAYDGSDEARGAIDFAAHALTPTCALVVHVWHDPGAGLAPVPFAAPPPLTQPQLDTDLEQSALECKAELIGVARAHASSLQHLLRGSVSSAAVRDERCPVLGVPE